MNIEDFIKLPASEAGSLYRHHRDAGDVGEASRLHQAYFEAHRVKLSDDRQIADAKPQGPAPAAGPASRLEPSRKGERSKVRLVGVLLSSVGVAIGLLTAAAGIGPAALVLAGCMTAIGFALWLVGIVEDRLVQLREAVFSLGSLRRRTHA